MSLDRFSWREICSRPLRAFLTVLSIAIGVGAVVAVLLATSTTRQAQRDILKTVSGKADVEVIADGGGFSYDVLKEVSQLADVEAAVPGLVRYGVLFTQDDRKARTQIMGIDPRIDQTVRDYDLVAGQLPSNLRQIMLDKSFADSLHISVGDQIRLLAKSGMQSFSVVGLVQPASGSAVALSSAAYLVLPAAQRAFQAGGKIDQIQIVLRDKSRQEQAKQRLAQALPEGLTVRSVRTHSSLAQETMFAPQNGLLMAIAFAIIIATFIIFNTFQMAVGERRKQLGILRAIGATPRQIRWMILRESLWVSLIGSIIGCVAGVYGARLLNRATETILQVDLPGVALQAWPFAVAVAIGLSVSVLGAIVPAQSAASVQPMEAIRAVPPSVSQRMIHWMPRLSLFSLPLGLLLIWLATRGILLGLDVVGVVLILLGCVLMIPRVLSPACRWLTDWLEPWLGVPARLAHKQLLRHVNRTSMTVGVLLVALATSIGMAGNVLDNVRNIRRWYAQTIIGDYFIRASLPDFASGAAADMPASIEQQVRQLAGIDTINAMRLVNVHSGEDTLLLIVRDFIGHPDEFFELTEGTSHRALQGLASGQVVVGSVLALRRNLKVGDSVPLQTEAGKLELTIAAVANDYMGGGLTLYMDREYAHQLLGIDGIDALIVRAQPGQLQAVEAELRSFCDQQGLILQSYAELVALIDRMVNGVVGSLWVLLALGCSIAAMGLVNTLTMNIMEQTREIGMLRVVAMTRGQVRRMIITQAFMLGVLGIIPGAVLGVFVQYAISLSSWVVLGHDVRFVPRPELFLGATAIGLALIMLAAWIPAERAARLQLMSALHYE